MPEAPRKMWQRAAALKNAIAAGLDAHPKAAESILTCLEGA